MFELDARLQQDTLTLGDFPLCRLLLMSDASYPWFILVPRREGVSEVFELNAADQALLWAETSRLADGLKAVFAGDKMNVATLGNVVSQLHMHVIVRRRTDRAWPAPVWGHHPAVPYATGRVEEVVAQLRAALDDSFGFVEAVL